MCVCVCQEIAAGPQGYEHQSSVHIVTDSSYFCSTEAERLNNIWPLLRVLRRNVQVGAVTPFVRMWAKIS